nr:hypothetical protein [Tanacetum cinerariifolium]
MTMATKIEQQVALDEAFIPSAQREMLHISPRVSGQPFAELLFEEEILEFLRNTKAYKEYYACTTREAAPKLKASARRKRGASASSFVTPIPSPTSTMTPSIITTTKTASQPPIPPTPIPSEVLQNLPTFESVFRFEDRVKSLEVNFSEFMRTNQSPESVSDIPDSLQRENNEFLRTIDDNMKKIIKEQVKSQVKVQVTRILPRIEESVNAQLKAEVLTRSSHSSRTSYAVATELSEMELNKILIDKMEGNKSTQRSDEQQNLYKALVDTYEADKTILDSYGESTILKRRRKDDDDQEGPSAGSDRGSKRRKEGGEHASASTPSELATVSAGMSTTGTQSRQLFASEYAFAKEPMQTTREMEEPSHPMFETGAEDQPIVQTSQHLEWFSQPRKPPTPDRDWNKTLPAVQGSAYLIELEYHLEEVYKATTNQLDWVHLKGQQYLHNLLKPLPLIPDNWGRRVIPFEHFINNDLEYLRGGKLSNLTVEERFAFNVSLRMFTRSIVIQRRVEDLQLGFESYQKKLNLTKPDTYRSNLKRCEAYTTYSNPRGLVYQNKDKKNRLMLIDELHKFSDGTLNDVRNALDDRLKGIRMQYLPTTIWRKGEKDRAAAMIQAIDKMLKTRRIMRSLERKQEEKQIEEDQAANARYWKIPTCYDDDDDYNFAITPNEPVDSLIMGDEHLNTIPATKSEEFIKSSVENLVPNPSESKVGNGCDVPACFIAFSNILFDADYDFYSVDDQSLSDEDFPKEIYLNPLFDKEIISMKIDPHHFNAESDLIKSLLNRDSLITSSSKIDSLFNKFTGELTLLKSILPKIDETDCHPKEETHFIQRLLYDYSSPRPPEKFVSENSNADIESFSPSPIRVEDNDSLMEEIDLSFTLDDPISTGIEEDDYDSERDILIYEELLDNHSLSLPENESFHFDTPSSSRPPTKPLDGNT